MARKVAVPPGTPWTLPSCATNDRVWNARWRDTRGLQGWARRDQLLAVNHFGTVRLYDISEATNVRTVGEIKIAGFAGERYHLAFHGDHVIQSFDRGLHVIDVRDPSAPALVATLAGKGPTLREGAFVGDVYYAGSTDQEGLFAQRVTGDDVIAFSPGRSRHLPPSAFARATARHDVLLVFGTSETGIFTLVDGLPVAGSEAIATKQSDVGRPLGTIFGAVNGLLVVVTPNGGCGVRVFDVERPTNPKMRPRVFKPAPCGAGISNNTLLVVAGEYQKYLSITRIELARPKSVAGPTTMLIEDPELSCGLLMIEDRGAELFVFGVTGRFALLRSE